MASYIFEQKLFPKWFDVTSQASKCFKVATWSASPVCVGLFLIRGHGHLTGHTPDRKLSTQLDRDCPPGTERDTVVLMDLAILGVPSELA